MNISVCKLKCKASDHVLLVIPHQYKIIVYQRCVCYITCFFSYERSSGNDMAVAIFPSNSPFSAHNVGLLREEL